MKTQTKPKILFCHCAQTQVLPEKVKEQVYSALQESGTEFDEAQDLCGLVASGDPGVAEWAQTKDLTVIACYPRAVKWLLHPVNKDARPRVLNMRTQSSGEIISEVLGGEAIEPNARKEYKLAPPQDRKAWFPIIDYDRCTQCMQCLSFCLFDVYGVDQEKKIQVRNPDKCKTDCPACSRVCPEAAIIFPKYAQSPINGAEINDADGVPEPVKVNISALLGGNIYDKLRERNQNRLKKTSRFSNERSEEMALEERKQCLDNLVKELGIPPEVLNALPSAETIRQKAQEKASAWEIKN